MDLRRLIEESLQQHATRPAFCRGARACTYAELAQSARALGQAFSRRGLRAGERVAAFLPNGPAYLELYLACALHEFVLVPLNLRLAAVELRAILEDARPRLCLFAPGAAGTIAEALQGLEAVAQRSPVAGPAGPSSEEWTAVELAPGLASDEPQAPDAAQLYYTSGTTGRPKGVVLTASGVAAHARTAVDEFELGPADVWGHFAPMFHLADAWALFAVTLAGGRHAFLPTFDAPGAFEVIAREGVSATNLVPTMLQRMVHAAPEERRAVDSMRLALSGGAPIAPELVRRVQELFGCEYVQTYGLTETSPFLTISRPDAAAAGLSGEELFAYRARTGRPFGAIELRVVDEGGREVPADDQSVGEIQARGPWVFPGYWGAPELTREAFEDGWFKTGDLATRDGRGSLNIVDRKKDVILSGGETVYSTEVENALYSHDLVQACAVFPVQDPEWGEVVAAAVVRRAAPGARRLEPGELRGHCRLFLASYKLPRVVYFVDELPLSGSGKVQKRLLRERCRELVPERLDP